MKRHLFALFSASTLALAGTAVCWVQSASAVTEPHTDGCSAETYTRADEFGTPSYAAPGPSAGSYNGSTIAKTLGFSLSSTTARSSTISAGATMSIDAALANISATTSYAVTKTVTTGRTYTDTLSVLAGYKGYEQAKVEYRKFSINKHTISNTCNETTSSYGVVTAITAVPFFSSCVVRGSAGTCTPAP